MLERLNSHHAPLFIRVFLYVLNNHSIVNKVHTEKCTHKIQVNMK